MECSNTQLKTKNPLAIWGRYGTSLSRFRKPANKAYRIYICTIPLGALFFADRFFAWPHSLYAPFLWSIFLWSLWAVAALWLISRADVYDCVSFGIRIATFLWSAAVIPGLAGYLNKINLYSDTNDIILMYVRAPVTEEALKFLSLILIVAISPTVIKRPLGAIIIGLITGLGFSFAENYQKSYSIIEAAAFSNKYTASIDWLMQRGIAFDPWVHSLYACVTAIGIYYYFKLKNDRHVKRYILLLAFYLCAVTLHGLNNYLVTADTLIWNPRSPAVLAKIITLSLLTFIIIWGMQKEQAWFAQLVTLLKQPIVTADESRQLFTRLCRTETRLQIRRVFGREAIKAQHLLQRLQLAYVNALAEQPDKTEKADILSIELKIIEARIHLSEVQNKY